MDLCGYVRSGKVGFSLVRLGKVRIGKVWLGWVSFGLDSVRFELG